MNKLRFGSIGLGRLGYEHAVNLATQVAEAELTALCDLDAARVAAVADELGVPKHYTDPAQLCADPDIDAVCIVSPSAFHVEQMACALAHGKHVFCEKPLGVTPEDCRRAVELVKQYPDRVVQLGFMRRFDPSYREAKERIDRGEIGKVVLVRSYSQDPVATIESTLKFAPHSGGQFLDMCVHDLDLVRWLTGSEIRNLWAIGGVFAYELYRSLQDGDNVSVMLQCENDAMGFLFAGRAAAHGCHIETEIIGTEGTLRISAVPARNQLEVMNAEGVCRPCHGDFVSRWHDAYVEELRHFCRTVRAGEPASVTVGDGAAATEAAYRCKESFAVGTMLPIR